MNEQVGRRTTWNEARALPDMAQLLVANFALVKRIVSGVCRDSGVQPWDECDLLGDVLLKLVDKDYAVIRAYRGECPLSLYLRTVIRRILLDRRVSEWGKWRASKKARLLGGAAVQIERLMQRDRFTRQEAIGLVTHDPRSSISSDVARSIAAELPLRVRPFTVPLESDELPSHDGCPLCVLIDKTHTDRAQIIQRALRTALATLTDDERGFLHLRFGKGRKIAHIARELGLDQQALYRMYSQILCRLRRALERMNVTVEDVRPILGRGLIESLSPMFEMNQRPVSRTTLLNPPSRGALQSIRAVCQTASVA